MIYLPHIICLWYIFFLHGRLGSVSKEISDISPPLEVWSIYNKDQALTYYYTWLYLVKFVNHSPSCGRVLGPLILVNLTQGVRRPCSLVMIWWTTYCLRPSILLIIHVKLAFTCRAQNSETEEFNFPPAQNRNTDKNKCKTWRKYSKNSTLYKTF